MGNMTMWYLELNRGVDNVGATLVAKTHPGVAGGADCGAAVADVKLLSLDPRDDTQSSTDHVQASLHELEFLKTKSKVQASRNT